MPGMHGGYPAVTSMQKADLQVALGRGSTTGPGQLSSSRRKAKVVHVDIDPARSGRTARPTYRSSRLQRT
jgi:acetolactate synthase-1/2/3 large subunit